MNIFNKITLRMLKTSKTRTLVTIIGVILSTAMICAITTLVSSLRGYMIDLTIYDGGDWYGRGVMLSENIATLEQDQRVSKVVSADIIGYALCGSKNEDKPYLCVIGADEEFTSTMSVHIVEGRMPQNASEILLPKHLEENGGLIYGIGDSISLKLGDRVDGSGSELFQSQSLIADECLNIEHTAEYTVVGKYNRPGFEYYSAPGYTAITVKDGAGQAQNVCEVFYKTKPAGKVYDVRSDYRELMYEDDINSSLLAYTGVVGYANIAAAMLQVILILIAIVLFSSISLIHNAFSISANERSRQFGLLSSIGATRKQIRKSVIFESSVISAIGIPIGILCGMLGIFITLFFVGSGISSVFTGSNSADVPFRFSVSYFSVAIAAVIAAITVRVCAAWPAKRVSKISPIEAIRQTREIKVSPREVKTSKLTYRLFGVEGMIARKHYKRNRRKYRSTVIALSLSIILFVTANSFCDYLISSVNRVMTDQGYDISYVEYFSKDDFDEDESIASHLETAHNLSKADAVTDWKYYFAIYEDLFVADMGSFAIDEYNEIFGAENVYYDNEAFMVSVDRLYIDDDDYRSLVKASGLDEAEYLQSSDPLPIVWDSITVDNIADGNRTWSQMNTLKPDASYIAYYEPKPVEGYEFNQIVADQDERRMALYISVDGEEEIAIPADEAFERKEIALGARASEEWMSSFPDSTYNYFKLSLIYPMRVLENYNLSLHEMESSRLRAVYYSTDHALSYKSMEEILAMKAVEDYSIYDYTEAVSSQRALIQVISVFIYGFIALMALIAAANVFNTISTNVMLRRREFSMLRSIGMNERGLNRMMNYECILYGVRSILAGIPLSILLSYLLYLAMRNAFDLAFVFPWKSLAIAAVSVFAIVSITMLYSMHKIKLDNPIETLKNDNI